MRQEFSSETQKMKTAALIATVNSALEYGEEGLKLAVQILITESGQTKLILYDLLWQKLDTQGRQKLRQYLLDTEK
ncbi:hypothetical protein [Gloeocapsa sp. PCC 73106]|uniref:hypothetical protein n=1 Tax=Gloeocapsa sp. PCC 73106 TaxID=102232 RepID=UPI0002AC4F9B|nr:hypothetical protein [Gloeocapsa sp. PCC 73106]ELR98196.1 hypothetical protein GLO73106DRAFT_00020230 [Gloeocapsa sp. PCC 73106]